jgi:hypothetical protein
MDRKFVLLAVIVSLVFALAFVSANPNGARTVTEINSTRMADSSPDNHSAIAGNITELNIYGESVTQSWQGYFGNVTGAIQLGDSTGNVLYNWSVASPRGQVYASIYDSITWSTVECFNMSNSSSVEALFNIGESDSDGINETFTLNDHATFTVGSTQFNEGVCKNTKLFNNDGTGIFDNVMLEAENKFIFASLLQEDVTGFDGRPHDFQMIVLEDGHGTDVSTTPYFFYVELY